jgi:hypothetical protein
MPPDFDLAECYLRQAREAHEAGDDVCFIAARQMLSIALGLLIAPTFDQKNRVNHPCG